MKVPFLLKTIAVDHFKAIQNSGLVAITPLTVFIGNNGSGKSSLIEALETYQEIMQHGLTHAFERWHGLDHVLNKRAVHRRKASRKGEVLGNPFCFHCRGRWGCGVFNSVLWVSPEPNRNAERIEKETLNLPKARSYRRLADGTCESFNDSSMERIRRLQPGESVAPQDWINLVVRWQFLRLEPGAMGEPARQQLSGMTSVLGKDGANLGQYLWSLRNASVEAFEGLLEALQVVLPYARDVQPVLTEAIDRLVHVEMTEESFKVPSWLLSTGTLRILALLACLRHPNPPPLLVVEEIENGLDPRTVNLVVEEIRAAIAAGTTQVILTTHSPYLLDLLDLSHIVVVERKDGQPSFNRPNARELAKWAKSFSPGQLYTMGHLTKEGQ